MVTLVSCDKNKTESGIDTPDSPDTPVYPEQPSGPMDVMTSEESKTFLQNTATDFLNKFQPEDQKEAIELAAYYSQEYGDLEPPVEFDIEPDGRSRTPGMYLKALASAAKGDMDALTRAATSYSYTLKFERFSGIYEPDLSNGEWVKTGDSNDIVFIFNNKSGQPVELKVTQAGGISDVDFTLTEWEDDYDYETGYWEEFEVKYNYFLSIPKNVTVTVKDNGKDLAKSTVVSNINVDGHTLSADIKATLMNLDAEVMISGMDTKIEAYTNFFISGEKVGTAYATINGNNLCNKKKYESFEDMDDDQVKDELAKMFSNGNCEANILGKVQAFGQATYYKEMPDDLGAYFDDYDYSSKDEARNECQKACDRLNKNVNVVLRYNNTTTDQATFQFAPDFDEWNGGSYWEYYLTTNIIFPDDTSYNLDSYFDKFTNVSNKWDALIDAYEKIWDSAGGRK